MAHPAPIRLGIVGAGGNTRAKHLPGFLAIPGVQVQVVCNRSEASSKKVAQEFGIPRIASRWQDVVEAEDVDAVVIGTWPSMHAIVTVAALARGKHVLTEARLARNLEEALQMQRAAEQYRELVAQVVPAPMSLDVDRIAIPMIQRGELGVIHEVEATHTHGQYLDASKPLTWRQDVEASGNNILTLGILHEIVQRWLGEDPAWVAADATIATPRRPHRETGQDVAVEIPDSVRVLGRMNSGASLLYHLSGIEPGPGRGEIRIHGSHAGLRLELATGQLFRMQAGLPDVLLEPTPDQRRGWRVEADFIDSIRTGAPVQLTSFADGVRYMRVVDAVWESWKAGGRKASIPQASCSVVQKSEDRRQKSEHF